MVMDVQDLYDHLGTFYNNKGEEVDSYDHLGPASSFGGLIEDEKEGGNIVLMQYTGLNDKNGKEIYEGDILEYEDKGNITDDFIEPVEWIDDKHNVGWGTESSANVWADVARLSKIIGNIYENPELLENK